jgi:hypothetical protein
MWMRDGGTNCDFFQFDTNLVLQHVMPSFKLNSILTTFTVGDHSLHYNFYKRQEIFPFNLFYALVQYCWTNVVS